MVSAGDEDQRIALHGINQAMLVVDASRPIPRQIPLERLRFADSFKRRSQNVLDELVDSLGQLAIMLHEPLIIVPGGRSESQVHAGLNARFFALPASASP